MAADDELKKMERYLSKIFTEAGKDLTQKALKYMADFERKEKVKLEKVSSGQITEDEYKEWRKNQLLYGEHWTRLIQLVQKEMVDCNKTALDYVNDKATKIFADSYNSIARVIDDSVVEGYSFELVDANTVKNLARSEGIILPPKKNLDVQKDKLWNAKQVNAQLLQGILQGESIPKIAARMQNVCDSNKAASIRNARTMVTAAENSGRQSGMNKAESDGIIFKKMWIATRDERTRESHMVLNGQLVANGEKFVTINGDEIEFPGDWRAEPSEVYNCRCTLGTIVTGYKPDVLRERLEEEPKEQEQEAQETERSVETILKTSVKELSESEIDIIRELFKEVIASDDSYVGIEANDFEFMVRLATKYDTTFKSEMSDYGSLYEKIIAKASSGTNEEYTHKPFSLEPSFDNLSVSDYEKAKIQLEESLKGEISDEKVKELVNSIYKYTASDFMDILAISAGPNNNVYKEHYDWLVNNATSQYIEELNKDVQNISEFLDSSPKYSGTAYRALGFDILESGVSGNWAELESQLKEGNQLDMSTFTSWTTNKYVCSDIIEYRTGYSGDEIGKIGVIMEVESKSGVLIQDFSDMKDQKEVMYNMNSKFEVIEVNEEVTVKNSFEERNVHVKLREL